MTRSRVFIIDDQRPSALLAASVIEESEGAVAEVYDSAQAALDACRNGLPDLVLIDYLMPGMNGIDFIRGFRALTDAFIPIIMVTADKTRALLSDAMAAGATDFLHKPWDAAELAARSRNMLALRQSLLDLQKANEDLRLLANTDPLTGALNRRAFLDLGRRETERRRRHGQPLSLLMADLDHFKAINDTYGHAAGDQALKDFYRTCTGLLRDTDSLGRLGGEEFAILLPETGAEGALVLAERLRAATEAIRCSYDGQVFGFTVSLGLATPCDGESTVDTLLRDADDALYRAKEGGRNRVEYDPHHQVKT
jgi:diguanylate cyclase (GGDEF)-like protein